LGFAGRQAVEWMGLRSSGSQVNPKVEKNNLLSKFNSLKRAATNKARASLDEDRRADAQNQQSETRLNGVSI
jgi:hypothetical protein